MMLILPAACATPSLINTGVATLIEFAAESTPTLNTCRPASKFRFAALEMVPEFVRLPAATSDKLRSEIALLKPASPAVGRTVDIKPERLLVMLFALMIALVTAGFVETAYRVPELIKLPVRLIGVPPLKSLITLTR